MLKHKYSPAEDDVVSVDIDVGNPDVEVHVVVNDVVSTCLECIGSRNESSGDGDGESRLHGKCERR